MAIDDLELLEVQRRWDHPTLLSLTVTGREQPISNMPRRDENNHIYTHIFNLLLPFLLL